MKFTTPVSMKVTQETMKDQKVHHVTRKQLAEIYDIACDDWKEKISKITQDTLGSFKEEGELDDRIVKKMFDAATPKQKPTLEKIFGVQDKNAFVKEFYGDELYDVSEALFGYSHYMQIAKFWISKESGLERLKGRSIGFSKDLEVKMHKAKGGETILEITKK